MQQYTVEEEISKQARWPHELFLINLIFNHVLMFVAFLTASSLQYLVLLVPIASLCILAYTLIRGKRSLRTDPWFVKCHWQLAVRRSKFFILVILSMLVVIMAIYFISGGHMKPQHWAFFAIGILPTMLSVLGLIIMESDALHMARFGRLPDWLVERYPEGALQPVSAAQ